jgi:hypothetical protein
MPHSMIGIPHSMMILLDELGLASEAASQLWKYAGNLTVIWAADDSTHTMRLQSEDPAASVVKGRTNVRNKRQLSVALPPPLRLIATCLCCYTCCCNSQSRQELQHSVTK